MTSSLSDYEDEFEEYRARSYSGGFSPSMRRRRSRPDRAASNVVSRHRHTTYIDCDVNSWVPARFVTTLPTRPSHLGPEHTLLRPIPLRPSSGGFHAPVADIQRAKQLHRSAVTDSAAAASSVQTPNSHHHDEMRPRVGSAPSSKRHDTDGSSKTLKPQRRLDSPKNVLRKVRSFTSFINRLTHHGYQHSETRCRKPLFNKSSADTGSRGTSGEKDGSGSPCSNRSNQGSAAGSDEQTHRVLLTGNQGVGKSAILAAFIRWHRSCLRDFAPNDRTAGHVMSITLDNEETTLEFIDWSDDEAEAEFLTAEELSAYVVVYSVEDRKSFEAAIDRLYELRHEEGEPTSSSGNTTRSPAVILVANKADLVRNRVILEQEGRSTAAMYSCKYIEVSAAIELNIVALLVGIIKQIRLTENVGHSHQTDTSVTSPKGLYVNRLVGLCNDDQLASRNSDSCCLIHARNNVLDRLCRGLRRSSKSCVDLNVL